MSTKCEIRTVCDHGVSAVLPCSGCHASALEELARLKALGRDVVSCWHSVGLSDASMASIVAVLERAVGPEATPKQHTLRVVVGGRQPVLIEALMGVCEDAGNSGSDGGGAA